MFHLHYIALTWTNSTDISPGEINRGFDGTVQAVFARAEVSIRPSARLPESTAAYFAAYARVPHELGLRTRLLQYCLIFASSDVAWRAMRRLRPHHHCELQYKYYDGQNSEETLHLVRTKLPLQKMQKQNADVLDPKAVLCKGVLRMRKRRTRAKAGIARSILLLLPVN